MELNLPILPLKGLHYIHV